MMEAINFQINSTNRIQNYTPPNLGIITMTNHINASGRCQKEIWEIITRCIQFVLYTPY